MNKQDSVFGKGVVDNCRPIDNLLANLYELLPIPDVNQNGTLGQTCYVAKLFPCYSPAQSKDSSLNEQVVIENLHGFSMIRIKIASNYLLFFSEPLVEAKIV